MRYRRFGATGMQVSTVCLGTMMFGAWGNRDRAACHAMLDAALDAGVNFIDTADVYAFGESETIVGEWLKPHRDRVVLATKFASPLGEDPNQRGGSRRWIMRAVEDSLRRLGTDWIDIYLMHRPDPQTPLDETLAALDDLIRHGKVRALGSSTFPAEAIVAGQWAASRRNLTPLRAEQPQYSIFARQAEVAVLPTCARHDLGVFVWSPLNGGWLTGKYRRDRPLPADSRAAVHPDHFDRRGPAFDAKIELVERLVTVALEAGLTLAELAVAFTLEHPAVAAAIIGPRTAGQLAPLLGAGEVELPIDVLDAIDEIVAPGVDVNPAGAGWTAPGLDVANRRRPR